MTESRDILSLRVEYRYDTESQNWNFVVPLLGIVGGAETRVDAERQALDAIAFTLESDATEPTPSSVDVGFVSVTLRPARSVA